MIYLSGVSTFKAVVVLATFLPISTFAQRVADSSNPVFRISSTLVQIDAVVTDAKGRHVTDLTSKDFQIYADGVLQPITHFSYVNIAPSANAPQPSSKEISKDPLLAPPPTITLAREKVRRTMVLMVDDLNLSFESMAFVRSSLLKFVDEQMEPGDLVAVCRTGAGSSAFQQFTSDRRLAHAVINSLRWNPSGTYGVSFFQPVSANVEPFASPGQTGAGDNFALSSVPTVNGGTQQSPRMLQQLDHLRQNTLTYGALGAIDYVVQALRDMPGRKSVILFSDGLFINPGDDATLGVFHQLIDRANRSGTVIYTMHATGLLTLQPDAADNPQLSGALGNSSPSQTSASVANVASGRSADLFRAQSGLEYLAYVTGGLAFFNGNSLNYGLGRVLEDQKGYYLLGYSPPSDTFDLQKGQRPYHKLQVVVKDKYLRVRSRTGFFGATDEETKPHFANAVEEIRAAMLSPFTASGVRLRLTPIYSEVRGRGPVVRNLLYIDARDLTFKPILDGSYEAKIKLLAAAYGPDNKQLSTFGYDYRVDVPEGKMEQVLRDGALYNLEIELPKPGGFHIRAAVRDEATQKTGSANEFIDIPDTHKKQLALTSIVLATAPKAGADTPSLGASAAKREFHRGDILQYFTLVENGDPKHISAADTSVQVRIVTEGKQIYLGPAGLKDLPDHKRAAIGLLKLGDQLPTGDYFIQVVASVPKDHKRAIANQWTDFAILP